MSGAVTVPGSDTARQDALDCAPVKVSEVFCGEVHIRAADCGLRDA